MKNFIQTSYLFLFFLLFPFGKTWGQVDVITADDLKATQGSYEAFRNIKKSNTVVYAGRTAREDKFIQMGKKRSNNYEVGIVTTSSNQNIKSIRVEWKKNVDKKYKLSVYGKNTPFKDADFFDIKKFPYEWGTLLTTIANGDDKSYSLSSSNRYRYIGIRSEYGTVYIKGIHLEWEKLFRKISFEKDLYEIAWGEAFTSPKLQGENAVYSSSDEGVATVDPQTGEVHIIGCGTTTITASLEETDIYQAETRSYKLMVNPSQVYSARFDFSQFENLFPEAVLGQELPDVIRLVSGEMELTITKGKEKTKIIEYDSLSGLRLSENARLELKVPKGFNFSRSRFHFYNFKSKSNAVKEESLGHVCYRVTAPAGILASEVEVNYTGTYKINIGKANHITFAGAYGYVLPHGLQGGIVSVDETNKVAHAEFTVEPNDIVSAGQALLLKGTPGEYTLVPTSEQGLIFDNTKNKLRPALTNDVIKAPEGKQLYIFASKNNSLGFFWQAGSVKGDAVSGIANKAYLELPISTNGEVQGYRLDFGESTGLEDLDLPADEQPAIYTLAGVRVKLPKSQLPQGVYIINGKKIYVN